MMCCAIAGLVMGALAACRGLAKGSIAGLSPARWAIIALASGLMLAGGAVLAANRLDRSHIGRGGIAAILLLHICGEHSVSRAS
jgi:hypothetical protein